jgi:hypothetical protein
MLIAPLVLSAAEVWLHDQFGYLIQDAGHGAFQERVKRTPENCIQEGSRFAEVAFETGNQCVLHSLAYGDSLCARLASEVKNNNSGDKQTYANRRRSGSLFFNAVGRGQIS